MFTKVSFTNIFDLHMHCSLPLTRSFSRLTLLVSRQGLLLLSDGLFLTAQHDHWRTALAQKTLKYARCLLFVCNAVIQFMLHLNWPFIYHHESSSQSLLVSTCVMINAPFVLRYHSALIPTSYSCLAFPMNRLDLPEINLSAAIKS